MRRILFSVSIAMLSVYSPLCEAQTLAPVIYLSSAETAKAKQLRGELKQAIERQEKARAAWAVFQRLYQAAHPELVPLQFTADYRMAFATRTSGGIREMVMVDLSPEERKKIEDLVTELRAADQGLRKTESSWRDFQLELAATHTATAPGQRFGMSLSDGRQVLIAAPWADLIIFSPDFRFIVPTGGY